MPKHFVVIVSKGGENPISDISPAELVFPYWPTIYRYEEPTSFTYPGWNGVRQPFANGKVHSRMITNLRHDTSPRWWGASLRARRRLQTEASKSFRHDKRLEQALPFGLFTTARTE